MTIEDLSAVEVMRGQIVKEYADGDLAVRIVVAAVNVERFLQAFPEPGMAAFLSCDTGAIEAVRDTLGGEYRDGALAVRILIAPKDKEAFRKLWPRPDMPAVLALENPKRGRQALMDAAVAAEESPAKYGPQARALRLYMNFVGNPQVWAAIDTDDAYLGWLRGRPCAYCKRKPHWEMGDLIQSEAAHVRRADSAGTAFKPLYSAIPLCHDCHEKQHRYGEGELGGQEWFDKQRIVHVVDWVWEALKDQLGYEHWNEIAPAVLHAWVTDKELGDDCLPTCYRPFSSKNQDGWIVP